MLAAITAILGWFTTFFVARALVGAGLALVTYVGLTAVMDSYVASITSSLSGLPGNLLAILAIAGVGEAISVVVSTVISVASLRAAARVAGIRVGGS